MVNLKIIEVDVFSITISFDFDNDWLNDKRIEQQIFINNKNKILRTVSGQNDFPHLFQQSVQDGKHIPLVGLDLIGQLLNWLYF